MELFLATLERLLVEQKFLFRTQKKLSNHQNLTKNTFQAKKVSKTVAKMLYKDNLAQDAKEQLSKFALQMVHVFPKFTVYGMFSVDGTLLFTVRSLKLLFLTHN